MGFRLFLVALLLACIGCRDARPRLESVPVESLFTLMPAAYTGINFVNELRETQDFNVFTYRNYHNGGGVAIADLNNDGLPDLYFTANQGPNHLYLNEGDFRFREVTRAAGVAGKRSWTTGVATADVNGDGWIDIYVSAAGQGPAGDRANELFINQGPDANGIPRFLESAEQYGIADPGYSVQGAFFDYDGDGDLDLYVVNNSPRSVTSFGLRNTRHVREPHGGDRLYRNDGERFRDVSEEAGIFGSEIAFGLDVTISDVNRDGYPDVFVSNDFFERDYLYVNGGDGTFTEDLEGWMRQTSLSSMGADAADVDNDGHPDIFVTDMLPASDYRLKMTSTFESWDVYRLKVQNGFYHQFMRNTLQRGSGRSFTEIGQMAGVEATDWSWGTLIADFDQDGNKDIFVTNGVFRDVTDQDFIDYLADEDNARAMSRPGRGIDFQSVIDRIPSHRLPNFFFHNSGRPWGHEADDNRPSAIDKGVSFTNRADELGLGLAGFSNGCAYGDLDGDGDLDLVVSNLNHEPYIYRNESDSLRDHHFLRIELAGEGQNPFGVGASIALYAADGAQYLENFPARGFQSSVDHILVAGLGSVDRLDSVTVRWPDGRTETSRDVAADQTMLLRQEEARRSVFRRAAHAEGPANTPPLLIDVTESAGLSYTHRENDFVDFHREPLLVRMLSREGPRAAVGDVNGDGLDDLFVGGAKGSAGVLFVQASSGTFTQLDVPAFGEDAISEDVGAAFFDADGDGDNDLYVVSGGADYSSLAPALLDRLYLNDGSGGFTKSPGALPRLHDSGSVVRPHDFDGDGDIDLFVGGRLVPWRYGLPARSALLENDGRGHFTDVTEHVAPSLIDAGMVTDAAWADVDGNGRYDLVLAGDWMPIRILQNNGGQFETTSAVANSAGWWNRIVPHDLDGDGDIDFVAGNLGLNTRLRASVDEPLGLFVHDFDRNGYVEQVLTYYSEGTSYPLVLRGDLLARLPFLAERFPTFASYAGKTLDDVFSPRELEGALHLEAHQMASVLLLNDGSGRFTVKPLPAEAQLSPVYGIAVLDVTGDGIDDIYLGGNFSAFKPEIGPMTESRGLLLAGASDGSFSPVQNAGAELDGDVRDVTPFRSARFGTSLIVARSNGPIQLLDIR